MSSVDEARQSHEAWGLGDTPSLPQYVDTSHMPEVIEAGSRCALTLACLPVSNETRVALP